MTRTRASNFIASTKGASALEFALVFPLFVMLLFGIIEFGRALSVQNELEFAASQASRMVMIDDSVSNSALETRIRSILHDLSDTDLNVVTSTDTVDGQGYRVVNISYPHQISTPFATPIDITMTATTRTPQGL